MATPPGNTFGIPDSLNAELWEVFTQQAGGVPYPIPSGSLAGLERSVWNECLGQYPLAEFTDYGNFVICCVTGYYFKAVNYVDKEVSDTFGSLTQAITNLFDVDIGGVVGSIDNILQSISNGWDAYTTPIINGVDATIDSIDGLITELTDDIAYYFDDALNSTDGVFASVIDSIGVNISATIDSLADNFDDIFGGYFATIDDYLFGVDGFFEQVSSGYDELFDNALAPMTTFFETFETEFAGFADGVVSGIADQLLGEEGAITSLLNEIFADTEDSFGGIVTGLITDIDSIIGGTEEQSTGLLDLIGLIPTTADEWITVIKEWAPQIIGGAFGLTPGQKLSAYLQSFFGSEAPNIQRDADGQPYISNLEDVDAKSVMERMNAQLSSVVNGILGVDSDSLDELLGEQGPGISGMIVALFMGISAIVPIIGGTIHAAIAPGQAKMAQDFAEQSPFNLPGSTELAVALRRGLISAETYSTKMSRQGFDAQTQDVISSLTHELFNVQSLNSLYHRNVISEGDYKERLNKLGFDGTDIDEIEKLSYPLPPVQDLITMAVREVFSPNISEAFGQFDEFPEDFAKWAKRQGISEQFAKWYWAAHWGLPSPQMGFDMFHRGIINKGQLEQLMKALDIMPYWRDKLVELAYRPLTRVDVRRMAKIGVLDHDEVVEAYKNFGYSPANAERMAEFTKLYNQFGLSLEDDEKTKLTRSQMVALYKQGAINRGELTGLLDELGYDKEAAEATAALADLELEDVERRAKADIVFNRLKLGEIDVSDAYSYLISAGMEEIEVDKLVTRFDVWLSNQRQLPSKSDVIAMYDYGLIDRQETFNTLTLLGYSDEWAERYIELADIKREAAANAQGPGGNA